MGSDQDLVASDQNTMVSVYDFMDSNCYNPIPSLKSKSKVWVQSASRKCKSELQVQSPISNSEFQSPKSMSKV